MLLEMEKGLGVEGLRVQDSFYKSLLQLIATWQEIPNSRVCTMRFNLWIRMKAKELLMIVSVQHSLLSSEPTNGNATWDFAGIQSLQ